MIISNSLAETVKTLLLNAIYENGNFWPSRIRVDYSLENMSICDESVNRRGSNLNSFLAVPSTRNQRIERLWRDVFGCVSAIYILHILRNGINWHIKFGQRTTLIRTSSRISNKNLF